MIISKEVLDFYFDKELSIEEVNVKLNSIGIINTLKGGKLYIEYPTIRPDCNAMIGIFIEIAAVMNCNSKIDINMLTQCERYIDNRLVLPYFLGKIPEKIWDEFPNKIQEIVLTDNKLNALSKHEKFRNFCAIMYGCVPFFLNVEENLDTKRINVVFENEEFYVDYNGKRIGLFEDGTHEGKYLITPIFDTYLLKEYLDKKHKSKIPLYYYFIRESNNFFVHYMYLEVLGDTSLYMTNGENEPTFFTLKINTVLDGMNRVLGNTLGKKDVEECLTKIGYMIDEDEVRTPGWRRDIHNIQDVVNDVYRFNLILVQDKTSITNNDFVIYEKIEILKNILASESFLQIITRPFIEKANAQMMERLYGENIESISLLNPYNKEKQYLLCSHYCNCAEKNRKCFEYSILKRKNKGAYSEQRAIGWYGDYGIDESISKIFSMMLNWFVVEKMDCSVIHFTENKTAWQFWLNDDIVSIIVIDFSDKNVFKIFGEFFVDYIMLELPSKRPWGDACLTRRYSIDLPVDMPLPKIIDVFPREYLENVKSIELIDAKPFVKGKNH